MFRFCAYSLPQYAPKKGFRFDTKKFNIDLLFKMDYLTGNNLIKATFVCSKTVVFYLKNL